MTNDACGSTASFKTRPFKLPPAVMRDIDAGELGLSAIMKSHAGRLGDYTHIKAWEANLRKVSNWVGNTVPFHYIVNYYAKQRAGEPHVSQTMFEQNGKPVGFLRLCHLQRDTETRRMDCTKVEETLVDGAVHLRDPSLFKAMYDFAVAESGRNGHARVITELGIGLSPQKYRSLARTMHRLKSKRDLTDDEAKTLAQASRAFYKDWVTATKRFVDTIGFEITDIVIPNTLDTDSTPQIRISRVVPGTDPLPLPDYTAPNRDCYTYTGECDLTKISDALERYRQAAIEKYPMAALA